jgi:hypothetical protein
MTAYFNPQNLVFRELKFPTKFIESSYLIGLYVKLYRNSQIEQKTYLFAELLYGYLFPNGWCQGGRI